MLIFKPVLSVITLLILISSLEFSFSCKSLNFCNLKNDSQTQTSCCREEIKGNESKEVSENICICLIDYHYFYNANFSQLKLPIDDVAKSFCINSIQPIAPFQPKDAFFIVDPNLNETYQLHHPYQHPYLVTIHTILLII